MSLPAWARAHASSDDSLSLFTAVIRTTAAEFDVTEELGYEFDGEGEHDYIYVEKTGANTDWVSKQLAGFAEVAAKEVGYSGLKDRHAVTRQWFSVPRWHSPDWSALDVAHVLIKDVQRHSKKLRRGAHKANRFRIVMRGVLPALPELEERLDAIRQFGVPNYYGPQRFGRNGANVQLADSWAAGKRLPRHKRSIAISSARSFLFNEILHGRVEDGTWNQLQAGDIANLDGSGSIFTVDEIDDELISRCQRMDIHPAAELAGDGSNSDHERWQNAFDKARVKPGSRSLRLRVQDLQFEVGSDSLTLSFALGRGAFATSVLREIASFN
jgi:tRNA pseudouridine13 synthase